MLSSTLKNLFIRALSGAVLVAVLLTSILSSQLNNYIILSLIGVLSVCELAILLDDKHRSLVVLTAITAITLSVGYYFDMVWIVIIPLMLRMIIELYRKNSDPITSISRHLFSICYPLLPMLLLTGIDGKMVVALLFMVWSNDVGAYIVGVLFGRRRLFPRLSPKKSWEGFWGGLSIAVIVAIFIGHYYFEQSVFLWAVTGCLISLAAVVGDLFESMIKRNLGVKDSGDLIPGHGGLLDRFDALFFASPIFYILYIHILN